MKIVYGFLAAACSMIVAASALAGVKTTAPALPATNAAPPLAESTCVLPSGKQLVSSVYLADKDGTNEATVVKKLDGERVMQFTFIPTGLGIVPTGTIHVRTGAGWTEYAAAVPSAVAAAVAAERAALGVSAEEYDRVCRFGRIR